MAQIEVDSREIRTLLAALRLWQRTPRREIREHYSSLLGLATDNGAIEALDDEEVNDLFDRCNEADADYWARYGLRPRSISGRRPRSSGGALRGEPPVGMGRGRPVLGL
jgi:hypothetical protein